MLLHYTRTLCAALLLTGPATALTIDFESFDHGELVDGVTVNNPDRSFDLGVAFDTNRTGTADDDLERGSAWSRREHRAEHRSREHPDHPGERHRLRQRSLLVARRRGPARRPASCSLHRAVYSTRSRSR